jgi:hypothetical protein
VSGDRPRVDAVSESSRVLADAAGALAVHVDDGGFCRGCVATRARLVPFPCARVVWARSVQASLGDPAAVPTGDTGPARHDTVNGGLPPAGGADSDEVRT